MATNHFLLGIICLAFTHFSGLFGSGTLTDHQVNISVKHLKPQRNNQTSKLSSRELAIRQRILFIAQSQLLTREATNHNDGLAVERYLIYTGNKKGEPWCASFVSWVFGKAGYPSPRTAASAALFPLARRKEIPLVADVFGIYFSKLGRIGHCGLVEKDDGNWITTIEGNTNLAGSREGDGVYRKRRHRRTIKYFADWVNLPRKELVR